MRTKSDVRIPYVAEPIVLFPSGRHRTYEILARAYLANGFRRSKVVTNLCQTYPLEHTQQANIHHNPHHTPTTTPQLTNTTTLHTHTLN